MTRGMKAVAAVATLKLRGLAVADEVTSDYIRFRANNLKSVDAAQKIADELTDHTGILVVVVF